MPNRQLALFGKNLPNERPCLAHGGDVRNGKRKVPRPWDGQKPVHVVLRSSLARGPWSLLGAEIAGQIEKLARTLSSRYGVSLYRYANAGNHIHMLAHVQCRMAFQSFVRVFAGQTAQMVTGACRGRPVRFWDSVAYSRIVSWGRELRSVGACVKKNEEEALGLRPPRVPKSIAR